MDIEAIALGFFEQTEEYGGIFGLNLAALGLPSEEDFVARCMQGMPGSAPLLPFQIVHRLHQHLAALTIIGRYGISAPRRERAQVNNAGVGVKVWRIRIGHQHGYSSRRQSSASQLSTSSG